MKSEKETQDFLRMWRERNEFRDKLEHIVLCCESASPMIFLETLKPLVANARSTLNAIPEQWKSP